MTENIELGVAVVEVTPELAQKWLGHNRNNRNIRRKLVQAYARDMVDGNWKLTGEAVKFDDAGKLIDGQHRLSAVVVADRPVPMLVIRGLAPEAQEYLDTGAKRVLSDLLQFQGYRNTTTVAAAARLGFMLEVSDTSLGRNVTNSELRAWIERNPDIEEAALVGKAYRQIGVAPSVLALSNMWFRRVDEAAAAEFMDSLGNNQTNGDGDPRNTLLRRLRMAAMSRERLDSYMQLSLMVRTWNAWRQGQELRILRSSSTRDGKTKKVVIPKVK